MMMTYSMLTKPGDRDINEDCVLTLDNGTQSCFALSDGLGGQGDGSIASDLVLKSVESTFQHTTSSHCFIQDAFLNAQQELLRVKHASFSKDMMSTLVLLSIGETIQWGHIGDSRLYHFHNGQLSQQTMDHSVPQVLVLAHEISHDEIRHHPDRNRLLKAMGREWSTEQEFSISKEFIPTGKESFLICSDGFWEHITEDTMEQLLASSSTPEQWLSSMEQVVTNNGSTYDMDNYSAIAVWITN